MFGGNTIRTRHVLDSHGPHMEWRPFPCGMTTLSGAGFACTCECAFVCGSFDAGALMGLSCCVPLSTLLPATHTPHGSRAALTVPDLRVSGLYG
jgi:hypothetical protein